MVLRSSTSVLEAFTLMAIVSSADEYSSGAVSSPALVSSAGQNPLSSKQMIVGHSAPDIGDAISSSPNVVSPADRNLHGLRRMKARVAT